MKAYKVYEYEQYQHTDECTEYFFLDIPHARKFAKKLINDSKDSLIEIRVKQIEIN